MIIYQATNRSNGKRYIGATKHSIRHRSTGHWHDANGRNFCRIFGAALRKYGRDGFDWEVLVRCSSKEEMVREEVRLIDGLKRAILKRSKRVVCEETGAVYDSISAAARAVGRCVESVSASIRRNGRCGGKTFKFEASSRGPPTAPKTRTN